MLKELNVSDRKKVTALLSRELHTESSTLPSSIITDSEGNILKTIAGIPTLSEIRKWAKSETNQK
jgi:hypothetical protein